jgi:alanine-synthesizing transaminase
LALCREFDGLSLIVDEVFLDYGAAGRDGEFCRGLEGVPVFVVSGLSKIAGLPQMKAAWIVARDRRRRRRWSGWR